MYFDRSPEPTGKDEIILKAADLPWKQYREPDIFADKDRLKCFCETLCKRRLTGRKLAGHHM
ncbi:hypothetical protein W02_28040 [Nitrospira sp. KM1]|nr:hypothetical protein W02_28040 [Nitrospira sp. KM1]